MHVDLTGKRALVTGASGGIGFEVAKGLLSLNASVIITGRDAKKLALAKDFLQNDTSNTAIETHVADFSAFSEVEALAQAASGIDLLFNNAGILTKDRAMTSTGHEVQWQVNYLAPAYLSLALAKTMPSSGKIINVASGAHRRGRLDFNDFNFDSRPYSALRAYSQSKLAMILLTRHLGHLWGMQSVHINAVHPGIVRTDFARGTGVLGTAFNLFKPFYQSPRAGARGVLNVACSPFTQNETGAYFFNSRVTQPAKQARDTQVANDLYRYSCDTLGIDPDTA